MLSSIHRALHEHPNPKNFDRGFHEHQNQVFIIYYISLQTSIDPLNIEIMSSSSSTSSCKKNPKKFKLDLEGNVYCNHDLIAIPWVAGPKSSRIGAEFYGCPLWPNQNFKFFMWKEEVDEFLKIYSTRKDQEIKEMQIENLKLKNMVLQEENKNLKLQLSLNKSNWKSQSVLGLAIVVIATWWTFFV